MQIFTTLFYSKCDFICNRSFLEAMLVTILASSYNICKKYPAIHHGRRGKLLPAEQQDSNKNVKLWSP